MIHCTGTKATLQILQYTESIYACSIYYILPIRNYWLYKLSNIMLWSMTCDVYCQVWRVMSYGQVWHVMSTAKHDVWCHMAKYEVWCHTAKYDVWCHTDKYDVWCHTDMYDVWCLLPSMLRDVIWPSMTCDVFIVLLLRIVLQNNIKSSRV